MMRTVHAGKNLVFMQSVAVIVGGVVGAGVLGLPFAISQVGLYRGLLILLGVGAALMILRLLLAEAVLRTRGDHQLSGYVEHYFGRYPKYVATFVLILGTYGSMLTYTIGQGEVLKDMLGGSPVLWTLVAYAILSAGVAIGLRAVRSMELIMTVIIFFSLLLLSMASVGSISFENVSRSLDGSWFVVYGVALFACSGLLVVPEAKEILMGSRRADLMFSSVVTGSILPVLLYSLFASIVIGVTGVATTEIATIGLGHALGRSVVIAGSVFALFAMATSFLALGLALYEIYRFDYKLPKVLSTLAVIVVPIGLFMVGVRDFIMVMGLVGALGVGTNGLFALAVFWKARKYGDRDPEFSVPLPLAYVSTAVLVLMLLTGMVYVFV